MNERTPCPASQQPRQVAGSDLLDLLGEELHRRAVAARRREAAYALFALSAAVIVAALVMSR